MGAIWKFKKVEYLSAEEATQRVADYLTGDISTKYKISVQRVGNYFRLQYIKIKKMEV